VRVDGNDVLAVYAATKEAVDRARAGGGPTMIESVTFRMGPHSSSDDPSRYRSTELMEEWKKRDPIARFQQYLVRQGEWDDEREATLHEEAGASIQSAVEEAEKVGPPPLSTMFEDVYAEMTPAQKEQWEGLRDAYERGVLSAGQMGEFPL